MSNRPAKSAAYLRHHLLGTVFILLALFFMCPICFDVFHIGMIWPAAVFLALALRCFLPYRWARLPRLWRRAADVSLVGLLCVTGICLILLSSAAKNTPQGGADTVIVAGCRVCDGRPSVMLQNRIDAAYAYLAAHPGTVCICSGGVDKGESVSEADCIADTLCAMGIDSSRIYREDASRSTAENFRNSAALIKSEHLSSTIAIATDNFHEYRAALYARISGLTPYAIGCSSPWYLDPGYRCREMIAVISMFFQIR